MPFLTKGTELIVILFEVRACVCISPAHTHTSQQSSGQILETTYTPFRWTRNLGLTRFDPVSVRM